MFLENLLNSLFLRQLLLLGWFLVFFSRLFTEFKLNSIGMPNSNISEDSPSVSVIVPARNEENNLGKCLFSLQQQDYPNLEFIIVDDCSIDKTRNIIKKYVKNDSRFKIVELDDQEPNWVGKNWACYNGYLLSTGKYLLFTDADTEHSTNSISTSISYLRKNELDVLTLFPKLICQDFWSKVIMPFLISMIYIVYSPIRLNSKKDPIAYLIGGFILIKRTVYEQIGGHKTVKHSFVEDKALGEILKTSGFNIKILEAKNNLKSFSRIGFKHNFNAMQRALSGSIIAPNILIAFPVIIFGFITLIIPYCLFFYDLYGSYSLNLIFSSLILFFILLSYFLEFKNILHTNKIFVFFHPLSALIQLFALFYCTVKVALGYDFIWRDRKYKKFKM